MFAFGRGGGQKETITHKDIVDTTEQQTNWKLESQPRRVGTSYMYVHIRTPTCMT